MDADRLEEVLRHHKLWLDGDHKGNRAYLGGASLTGAYLTGADLGGANLTGAYLMGAYLTGAYLTGAYLMGANLMGADLRGANLMGANLMGADLRGAYLRGAYLRGANLTGAYLRGANLTGATLNWQSHDVIAELLLRDAGDDVSKRKVAGLILVSRDWCWSKFLAVDDPERDWALSVLRGYVVDGDGAPDILKKGGE